VNSGTDLEIVRRKKRSNVSTVVKKVIFQEIALNRKNRVVVAVLTVGKLGIWREIAINQKKHRNALNVIKKDTRQGNVLRMLETAVDLVVAVTNALIAVKKDTRPEIVQANLKVVDMVLKGQVELVKEEVIALVAAGETDLVEEEEVAAVDSVVVVEEEMIAVGEEEVAVGEEAVAVVFEIEAMGLDEMGEGGEEDLSVMRRYLVMRMKDLAIVFEIQEVIIM
jgi:hypothetical protein